MTSQIIAPLIECHIQSTPLDVTALRRSLPAIPDAGGFVSFEGHVRNINHGKKVVRLDYEVYETLALKEMRRIALEISATLQLKCVRCWHRSGSLEVGDPAVLIQVLARHRDEAFRGCRQVIDQLKSRVPIWKKEYYDDGSINWSQCHEHVSKPLP
jgi:molybdopterin synthase catalytic subunit